MRWGLEDVSRAFGVPLPLLSDLQRATFANINAAERLFWRNTMIPEVKFLEEQLNEKLLPRLGYPELRLEFDLKSIEALRDDENSRVKREGQLLDRGVLTINEVRRERNLPDVPWGDTPLVNPGQRTDPLDDPLSPETASIFSLENGRLNGARSRPSFARDHSDGMGV